MTGWCDGNESIERLHCRGGRSRDVANRRCSRPCPALANARADPRRAGCLPAFVRGAARDVNFAPSAFPRRVSRNARGGALIRSIWPHQPPIIDDSDTSRVSRPRPRAADRGLPEPPRSQPGDLTPRPAALSPAPAPAPERRLPVHGAPQSLHRVPALSREEGQVRSLTPLWPVSRSRRRVRCDVPQGEEEDSGQARRRWVRAV